ncbi:MAG TPA: hypothetical protein VFV63_03680 [Ilumatobacteraceae bacterium]|nr:hypothetical protein [Ilumatobacteraceae bacterium]
MTDGSEWERPSTSSAPVPHESDVSNDVHTVDVHTVGKARGPVELVGLLLVIGAATFDLGQAIAAKDYQFNESAGDYFV